MLCVPLSVLILRITKCVKMPPFTDYTAYKANASHSMSSAPHPVTLRLVPGISGRSKIAEMNLFRSPVAFQVRTQHHRGSKGQPGKTRSLYRRQRHIPVFTNNNRRLIDKAIPETGCREPRRSDRARWPAPDSFPPDGHVNRV